MLEASASSSSLLPRLFVVHPFDIFNVGVYLTKERSIYKVLKGISEWE
jgi:hypothetical protein